MVHIKPPVLVITLNINDQNAPIKWQKLSELVKTRSSYMFVYELSRPKSLFRWGNSGNSDRLYFGGLQNHCRW